MSRVHRDAVRSASAARPIERPRARARRPFDARAQPALGIALIEVREALAAENLALRGLSAGNLEFFVAS